MSDNEGSCGDNSLCNSLSSEESTWLDEGDEEYLQRGLGIEFVQHRNRKFTEAHDRHTEARQDEPISPNNIGFQLLKKLGWAEGEGCGLGGKGIVKPLVFNNSASMEISHIVNSGALAAASVRPASTAEKIVIETTSEREKRQEQVLRSERREAEIRETLRPFYCEICDKQYKNIGELNVHISSYDHNHVRRLRDLRVAERQRKREMTQHQENQLTHGSLGIVSNSEQRELEQIMEAARNSQPLPIAVSIPAKPVVGRVGFGFLRGVSRGRPQGQGHRNKLNLDDESD